MKKLASTPISKNQHHGHVGGHTICHPCNSHSLGHYETITNNYREFLRDEEEFNLNSCIYTVRSRIPFFIHRLEKKLWKKTAAGGTTVVTSVQLGYRTKCSVAFTLLLAKFR
jgi:hypothetical protein